MAYGRRLGLLQPSRGGVILAVSGLLFILLAFPTSPAHAATPVTVTVTITITVEAGAPSFTWTITGCSASPSSGTSGTPQTVTMDSSCIYTISSGSATGNGTLRYRLTTSYATSVSETSCASGTCTAVTITAYAEEALVVGADCYDSVVSVASPTSDSWYNYGTVLTVSCAGVWGRSGGAGTRASSWNWDGGSNNLVATTGYFSSSPQTMNSHRAFNVNKVTQYQLTLDNGAALALEAVTTPTITSDSYWYDSGTAVTYQGHGAFGRTNGFGNRSSSWYLDSGTPVALSTSATFSVSITMSSPHTVHVTVKPQWQVNLDSVSMKYLKSITPPTVSNDNYWYDAGTVVTVVLNGTGARSGGVGSRLVSYSLNGGTSVSVSTTGTVVVINALPISGEEFITATSTTQYQMILVSGAANALASITPPSIAGDNYWYDTGTQVTYTGTGVFGRASGTGFRVADWWLDSGSPTAILTTGTFSVIVSMLGTHTLHTQTIIQYEVSLVGESSVSSATNPTISGDDYWYDGGTVVSLSLQGVFGRAAGTGMRMVSFSVNNGASIPTTTDGSVVVLSSVTLTSPQTVTVQTVEQFQVSFDRAIATTLDSITQPTVPGDNYWYDYGSHVALLVHGVWGRNSTEGYRLSSYSINGMPDITIASSGTITILDLSAISGPQAVASNSTVQYLLAVVGGSGSTYSVTPPIAGDTGWYDSGTTVRVSTNGTYDSSSGVRQRISGWSIDGGQSNPVGTASVVTTSAIVMDSEHSVSFYSVIQYLVTISVKDNAGANTLTPDSITLDINGGSQVLTFSAWVDNGASLQITSIMWMGVDVAPTPPTTYVVSAPMTVTLNARVYDATITVKDPLGLPIGGAACRILLANGTTVDTSTGGNGTVTLHMIPLGSYQGTVSAFGMSSAVAGNSAVQGTVVANLPISWAMIIVFVVVAIAIVLGAVFLLRRHRAPSYHYQG